MMKTTISILLLTLMFSVSCRNTNKNAASKEVNTTDTASVAEVPYTVAERYFVNNTVQDSILTRVITSRNDFDKYFGMAAVMGEDGKPTPVDFSTQFVLAVINKESDREVKVTPLSLSVIGEKVKLKYKIQTGEEQQAFTSRVPLILIVNKKYQKDVDFEAVNR